MKKAGAEHSRKDRGRFPVFYRLGELLHRREHKMKQDRINSGLIDISIAYAVTFVLNFILACLIKPFRESEALMCTGLVLTAYALLISKDFWSIGHKRYKLKVVDKEGNPATVKQKLLRNLTLLIWIIEVRSMTNYGIRYGDKLAGTKVQYTSDIGGNQDGEI